MLSSFSCACWPSVCLLWRNVYLGLLLILWLGVVFLNIELHELFIYLEINPLSIDTFANTFSHPEGYLFKLFIVSFAVQKLLSFIRSHLFIFVFISITLGGGSKKILLWFISKRVLPMFPSKSFMVSSLTFRSLIHFFDHLFILAWTQVYLFYTLGYNTIYLMLKLSQHWALGDPSCWILLPFDVQIGRASCRERV